MKSIICGLLETAANKTISYDIFFAKVEHIVNLVKLRIFTPKDACGYVLYLEKTDR